MSDPTPARGLLVDWGGVMTTNLLTSFASFCAGEQLDRNALVHCLRDDSQARALVIALETGQLDEADFERDFASRLGVAPEGLVDRLFADSGPEHDMQAAVICARRSGIPTGLLSNSWGTRRYPRERLCELFDAVTISGEVGLRKPAVEIYEMAARRIGVAPNRCVFVDDIPSNLEPARGLGMTTVHHISSHETIAALERLLEVRLR